MSRIKDGDRYLIEVSGFIKRMTGKAVLFHDGVIDVWLPISQIENDRADLGEGVEVNLLLPEWLAKNKELI